MQLTFQFFILEQHYLIINVIFFILGTCIGSFLNVVIYRTPNNQSVIKPRSHCQKCKQTIPFYYNIPIISFILLKGKCFNCKNKISNQYIFVEILCGLLFALAFDNSSIYQGILLSIVFSCMIVISYIDYYYLLIPSFALYLLITLLIPFSFIYNQPIMQIIIGSSSITLYLIVCTLIVALLKKEMKILGFGDILLIFFIGGWLGAIHSFICLFIAASIGIIYIVINNRFYSKTISKIPFGTCLSISFVLVILIKKYTNLFIN